MKFAATPFLMVILLVSFCHAQTFYFGNDLSYVNQMEDCGAIYKENSAPTDVYQIFNDHEANLVSVRLWVDPSWWQTPLTQPDGVKPFYNDLEDVKKTIQRAKAAGMQVMLGFQYSDFWADPQRQLIPARWRDAAYNLEALKDSVYNYTTNILAALAKENLTPELVKVGNEINSGLLMHIPEGNGWEPKTTVSNSWVRHAELLNAAIGAIRDFGDASYKPKIVIHFAGLGQLNKFRELIKLGVTDFDIMGISYYFGWHGGSVNQLQTEISNLTAAFPGYEAMVVETGYPWTARNFDSLGNIITQPDLEYLPLIPEKQLEYLTDYARAVMRGGGSGVVFWEPAWVSTPCNTPWGVGSSHDHLAFFDPDSLNFIKNGGGRWMERRYYENFQTTRKMTFKVDMSGQDVSNGVYISGSFTDEPWQIIPMANEGGDIFSYYTYLPEGSTGFFYFLNANNSDAQETIPEECRSSGSSGREYKVSNMNVLIELKWADCDSSKPDGTSKVELTNPGFEQPGFGEKNWDNIPGWSLDAPATDSGVANNPLATEGVFVAWLASNDGTLWQLTDYVIQAGDAFTLLANVRNSWQTSTFDLILYYDNAGSREIIAATTSDFQGVIGQTLTEFTSAFLSSDVPAAIGQQLGVAIRNADPPNSYIEIDNFRLFKTVVSSVEPTEKEPDGFGLLQSYPNPFNPETTIAYRLQGQSEVKIDIYNIAGQYIKTLVNARQQTGLHSVKWNGKDRQGASQASGVYFVQMVAGSFRQVNRMILLR